MKKILLLTLFVFTCSFLFSQQTGDYRTASGVTNGTWTIVSNWQVYNGSTWVTATQYPGQTSGTYSVTISSGTLMRSYTGSGSLSFGSLIVYGQLDIDNDMTLSTTKEVLIDGGTILWTVTKANLTIMQDGYVIVTNYTGTNGLVTQYNCNNNQTITIGTQAFSACAGGGNVDFLFIDVNKAGGTIRAIPTVSPNEICQGGSVNLTDSYAGLIGQTLQYSWNGTGPNGYTYSSTSSSPGTLTVTS